MTVREAADTYASKNWPILRIKRGEKMPVSKDWTTVANEPAEFSEEDNIGVRLGDGLVDVDLDCKEAVVIAKLLLPSNTAIHGRPGKPTSHYWFLTDKAVSEYHKFNDLDGTSMLELRATTRHQTVLPPSVHASGDTLEWENTFAPVHTDRDELIRMIRACGVAALLARRWPSGSRHATAGHLAGLLHRLGYPALEIPRIVRATAVAGGDEEPGDRERAARDTCEKITNGETRITGGPSISKIFGADVLTRIYTWHEKDDDNEIDKLNAMHFVAQIGDKMVVGTEFDDTAPTFMANMAFVQRYYNRLVGKERLGEFWLRHRQRREYRKIVFAPPPMPHNPADYNLWKGFAADPLPEGAPVDEAHIQRFLDHIHEVICCASDDHYNYVLDLLAATVQAPGRPTGKVLGLRGHQGVGKSLFVGAFGSLFGRHFAVVSDRKHVTGHFNSHLSGKVVVFADEAIWGGDRQNQGTWKRLVTEKTVMIERKGLDAVEEPNCIHLFAASNESWMLPAGERERRAVILDVDDKERTAAYFQALVQEAESPLFKSTLLTMLQRRDVSHGRWRGSLNTSALREQQEYSGGPVQQWWAIKLADGYVTLTGKGRWENTIVLHDAFTDYLEEMKQLGHYRDLGTRIAFTRKLRHYVPKATKFESRIVKRQVPGKFVQDAMVPMRCIVLPGLTECRHHFDSVMKTTEKWLDSETPAEALTLDLEEKF